MWTLCHKLKIPFHETLFHALNLLNLYLKNYLQAMCRSYILNIRALNVFRHWSHSQDISLCVCKYSNTHYPDSETWNTLASMNLRWGTLSLYPPTVLTHTRLPFQGYWDTSKAHRTGIWLSGMYGAFLCLVKYKVICFIIDQITITELKTHSTKQRTGKWFLKILLLVFCCCCC